MPPDRRRLSLAAKRQGPARVALGRSGLWPAALPCHGRPALCLPPLALPSGGRYVPYVQDGPLWYTPLLSRCAVHIPSCMYAATPCCHTQLPMACPSPSRCAGRAVAPPHRCYFGNLQGYRLAAALDLPRIELPAKARTVASGLGRVTGGRGGGVVVWWRTQLRRPAVAVPVRCNGTPAASPLLPSPVPHPTAPRRRPLVGGIDGHDASTLSVWPHPLVHLYVQDLSAWYIMDGTARASSSSSHSAPADAAVARGMRRCRPRHAPARPAAPNGQTAMRFPRYHGSFLPPLQSRPPPPPPSLPFLV